MATSRCKENAVTKAVMDHLLEHGDRGICRIDFATDLAKLELEPSCVLEALVVLVTLGCIRSFEIEPGYDYEGTQPRELELCATVKLKTKCFPIQE
jgi:hypothetical protein